MGMVLVFIAWRERRFNRDTQKEMQLGSAMQIGPYTLVLQSADSRPERNFTAQRMIIEVMRDNKPLMMLYPEKRRFVTTVRMDDGGDLLDAEGRFIRGFCWAEPGYATPGHSRVF